MYSVHKYMALDSAQVGYFIEQVGSSAASFGVTAADIKTVAESLQKTFGQRCAPAAAVLPGEKKELQAICVAVSLPFSASTRPASLSTDLDAARDIERC